MENNESLSTHVENPFGTIAQPRAAEVERASSAAIAEIQGAMVIAQKFPRDPRRAMDRIIEACTRPSLAQGALYVYSRGGTDISGPSIRLAEVAAQAWGNINFGIRELEQANGVSTVEAFAWDLETNTKQVKVFQVPHIRSKRTGNVNLTDPRDIYELVANQGARRLRACILGVIPGDVIEAAVEQCDQTMNAQADTSPKAIAGLLVAFEKIGVTKEMIETRIQRKMEAIRPAQIVNLKKIGTSIRDGMSEPGEWFQMDAKEGAGTSEPAAKPQFKKPAKAAADKPQTAPAASKEPPPQDKPQTPANPVPAPSEAAPRENVGSSAAAPTGTGQQEKKPDAAPLAELAERMEKESVRRDDVLKYANEGKGWALDSFRKLTEAQADELLAEWGFLKDFITK